MNKPSQLPASHAEDANAGIGMGFLVTFSVHVGGLDEGQIFVVFASDIGVDFY